MDFIVRGNLDKNYFKIVRAKLKQLLPIPDYIDKIFITDHIKHAAWLFKDFPKTVREGFIKTFEQEQASMAFTYKDTEIIIILISESEEYLKRDVAACIGTLAHELIHVFQKREGLNEHLNDCFSHFFNEYYKILLKLKLLPEETEQLSITLGETAMFVLKDLYMASELIDRGLGDYLLEAYYRQFIKPMKAPVFYDNFEKATRMKILNAILFELALLTVILPFQRYPHSKAKNLINYIQTKYEPHVQEIVKEFYEIDRLYELDFSWSWEFQHKYYQKIFTDATNLLKQRTSV